MFKKIFFFLLGPLLLLFPAFYNGYPLVYSDTGTYIQSGMEMLIPNDRPIFYGLFIRIFSLGFSLWLVIYIQALISFYCLFKLSKIAYQQLSYSSFMLLLLPLSLFSGLSWYSSQIMPDIFSFYVLASLILLLYRTEENKIHRALYALIFIFSLQVHFSNSIILLGLVLSLFLLDKSGLMRAQIQFKFRPTLILFALSLLLASGLNYTIDSSFKITKGGHVFLMGKMLDSGVLQSFLNDKCEDQEFSLCAYKDQLPEDSRSLLWSEESPLILEGGWQATEESYRQILFGILTSPKHLALYTYNAAYSSLSQLVQIDLGSGLESNWYREASSPPYTQIEKHFKLELKPYLQARQNGNLWKQELNLKEFNFVYKGFLFLSLAFIMWLVAGEKRRIILDHRLQLMFFAILMLILLNAIVTASLANTYDRLQARVSWLVIWFTLIVIQAKKKELSALKEE